ncbi:ureidoglycolate hydrolase [Escherichia coli]|uniref:Ureidoglycolate hydrolase n=1 Tax=Escherichia coli TaxID=562 RepID=A0A376MSQ8_ECOLX|nr:ureidoglycolate hydrolase [Escherichia coli]
MKLQVLPLSQEAFSAYGDVIETQQRDFFHINNGLVERYHDLALVEILEQDRTLISINRAQPANLPLTIHETRTSSAGHSGLYPDER